MKTSVRKIINEMERIAPPWMRCADDPIGLHAGNRAADVNGVLLALDATIDVVAEALERNCQMVITHHPRLYRPAKSLAEDTCVNAALALAIRHGIAIYCAHTNLDVAPGGINDTLADLAGLPSERKILSVEATEALYKLVVFVPASHLDELRDALCEAGAGNIGTIGNYTDCSFAVAGTGTFRGNEKSNPTIGEPGRLEHVEEYRLELLVAESALNAVENTLRRVHPYEEPAWDVLVLRQKRQYGLGRYGRLETAMTLEELARKLQAATGSPQIQILGPRDRQIKTLGVWSGAGFPGELAGRFNLDAIITGELSYHAVEDLDDDGTSAIILGHGPCEEVILPVLKQKLETAFPGLAVEIAKAQIPPLVNFRN